MTTYAEKDAIRHAVEAARACGIDVEAIELRPDGSIYVGRASRQEAQAGIERSSEEEFAGAEKQPARTGARKVTASGKDDQKPWMVDMPFTVETLAKEWGCSTGAVRSRIRSGELQAFRIGTLIRITASEVRRYEEAQLSMSAG